MDSEQYEQIEALKLKLTSYAHSVIVRITSTQFNYIFHIIQRDFHILDQVFEELSSGKYDVSFEKILAEIEIQHMAEIELWELDINKNKIA